MNPLWRVRMFAAGGAVVALWLGSEVAEGNYALPLLASALAIGAGVARWQRLPLDAVVLGGLLVGYIVGNRGFAQLSFVPGLPLFPAEVGLILSAGAIALRLAFAKTLPIERDFLNGAVLFWIALGAARIAPDVRTYGFAALRDFALIYYAGFFFAAQSVARSPEIRRWLGRCLLGATITLPVIVGLFRAFPEFFLDQLVWNGVPLIFLKGDLAGTFMAVGVVLAHQRYQRTRARTWLAVTGLCAAGVLISENRAALLGLMVATLGLGLARHWSLLRWMVGGAAATALIFVAISAVGGMEWRDTPVYATYERIASIVDVSGQRDYVSSSVEFKGDNNRFRLVWWQSVIATTWEQNPWLGQGFGFDLASDFVRRYYADNEEFGTRSPHSVLLTIFGRMGFAGLAAFLFIAIAVAVPSWRALRADTPPSDPAAWWMSGWIIGVSACFGVVLEGPMGAVVFWTVLGLANSAREASAIAEDAKENMTDLAPDLPVTKEAVSAERV